MKTEVSQQYRAILAIATFWADRAVLELCPKHALKKLAPDEKSISKLRNEIEGLHYEIKGIRLNEKRLEEELKGAEILEKILIEEKVQAQTSLEKLEAEETRRRGEVSISI